MVASLVQQQQPQAALWALVEGRACRLGRLGEAMRGAPAVPRTPWTEGSWAKLRRTRIPARSSAKVRLVLLTGMLTPLVARMGRPSRKLGTWPWRAGTPAAAAWLFAFPFDLSCESAYLPSFMEKGQAHPFGKAPLLPSSCGSAATDSPPSARPATHTTPSSHDPHPLAHIRCPTTPMRTRPYPVPGSPPGVRLLPLPHALRGPGADVRGVGVPGLRAAGHHGEHNRGGGRGWS